MDTPTSQLPALFRTLSSPLRLKILDLLSLNTEWLTVTSISGLLAADATLVSAHLQVLLSVDLVTVLPSGKFRMYKLNPSSASLAEGFSYLERMHRHVS